MNTPPAPRATWDSLEAGGALDGLEWEYAAPDDACPVGRSLHGQRFATLADVYRHLPNLNENPSCERRPFACTALPIGHCLD